MKKTMRILSSALLILGLVMSSQAKAAGFSLDLEPIVGYDMVQKLVPTAHTTSRLVYGGRLTLGFLVLGAEAEFTRGEDNESFSNPTLTTTDRDDKLKVGLRSNIRLGRLLLLTLRGGAQAKQNTHSSTSGGVTTNSTSAITYDPYGGLGLGIQLNRKIRISAGVTAVFGDFPDMSKNEYQYTLGFAVSLP